MNDQELLKVCVECFEPDFYAGVLIRKKINGARGQRFVGKLAGGFDASRGYFVCCVGGKNHRIHRLLFLMYHGFLPKYLDHQDRNRRNNSISNLRPASNGQNQLNSKPRGKSQYKGVCWHKDRKKWRAQIRTHEKVKYLGYYTLEEDAAIAYNVAAVIADDESDDVQFRNLNVIWRY